MLKTLNSGTSQVTILRLVMFSCWSLWQYPLLIWATGAGSIFGQRTFSLQCRLYHSFTLSGQWTIGCEEYISLRLRVIRMQFNWCSKHQEEHSAGFNENHIAGSWSNSIKWSVHLVARWHPRVIRRRKGKLLWFSALRLLSQLIMAVVIITGWFNKSLPL